MRLSVLACLVLAGCYTAPEGWDTPPASGGAAGDACVAGEQVECPCTDGSKGVQRCNPDGSSYGRCECSGGPGGAGGSVGSGGDGSGGLGGAAPGAGGDISTGGIDSGGTGGSPEPQEPRCDWIPECEPLLGACTVTYTVMCGSVEYGSVSCGAEGDKRVGWAFGDGHSVMCPADTSDCIAEGQEASSYCADLMIAGAGGSGSGGGTGSGGTGGGETVLWAHDHQETRSAYLGGIATESYHRAVLQFTINREGLYCSVQLTTPARPTGWTGSTDFELTAEQLTCFRDTYAACGDPRLHLSWLSCNSASGCATFQSGNVRTNVFRPVCSGVDLSGTFKVRHTVRALGPDGVDETWSIVMASE